uniref:C2H2-type domain-containing protein n=1 Tax=Leptobrachium leishanense TaxID=445787 RepID=A0A8C5Q2L6_9ANUR
MNPDTARDPLSQRILDLTLEMIFLLTGEGHMVVKIHETVTDRSRHLISVGHGRSQSFNTKPPPHSGIHEKILELSNQIIRLLTGEVPIRCEDDAVHPSMEEWEYVEGRKELYKDDAMEKHQPVITPADTSVSGEMHTPASVSHFGTENVTSNEGKCLKKTTKGQIESATHTQRDSLGFEERHVPEKDPTTECTDYPCIEPEPDSCAERNPTGDVLHEPTENTQTQYTSNYTGAESESCGEGDISHPDISPLPELTQTEYPSTDIKEESPTYGGGNLTGTHMYEPPEHTQTELSPDNLGEYLKGDANQMEINHRDCLTKSRNTGQSIYYTDIVTQKSVYKGTSAPSSAAGNISFPTSDLVIHGTNCTEESFCSTVCGEKSTPESPVKRQHLRTEGQSFSCPECGEHFTDSVAVKMHQRIHKGKKEFKCPECGKCFNHASHLTTHKRIHLGEKPFKCEECGKRFTQASHLTTHKLTHTGLKQFICTDCGKCFTLASNLVTHKRIHTGEKPFICTECGDCFTQSISLTVHKMVHTGEKPFKCMECGKCFTQASNLARHKRTHSGGNQCVCSECGKCFTRASYLAKHKMTHTG